MPRSHEECKRMAFYAHGYVMGRRFDYILIWGRLPKTLLEKWKREAAFITYLFDNVEIRSASTTS